MTKSKEVVAEKKFSKKALIASEKYMRYRDALKVLLKDKELYTIAEADAILNAYLTKEV